MLGAGFVTRPTLDILSDAGIEVSVGMEHLFTPILELYLTSLQHAEPVNPRKCKEARRRSKERQTNLPRCHRRQSSRR